MRLESAFLSTRVARRILGLFILCAVVPIGALAAVSYRIVSAQLVEAANERLRQSAKISSMELMSRLLSAAAELERDATAAREGRPVGRRSDGGSASFIEAVHWQRVGAAPPAAGWPVPTTEQWSTLASGRPLLLSGGAASARTIYLGRAVDPGDPRAGSVWARIEPERLWRSVAGGDADAGQPGGSCLLDERERALACVGGLPAQLLERAPRGDGRGAERIEGHGEVQLAASWAIFLGYEFGVRAWTVVTAEPESYVLGPLGEFRATFALLLALSLGIVFMLSNVQIRRSLTPLARLHEGTQHIAARDFSHRVDVRSGDEFETLAASFNAMSDRLRRQFTALTAINEIDRAALSSLKEERVVEAVLARARDVVPCSGACVGIASLVDPGAWRVFAGRGGVSVASAEVRLDEEADRSLAAVTGRVVPVEGASALPTVALLGQVRPEVRTTLTLPVHYKGAVAGCITLGFDGNVVPDDDDEQQGRQLADQLAVALSSARLLTELDELNWGALTALARAIDANSPWTAGHSERVSVMASAIGRALGLPDPDVTRLHRGGLLHDIGKIGVPAAVLNKPAPLDPEERRAIESHPTQGARILAPIRAYQDLIPMVLSHHEVLDGSGYPNGLRGDQIPFLVRILTVADVFDALVSDRPYRQAWAAPDAIQLLLDGAERQYDPRALEGFVQVLAGADHEVWRAYPFLQHQLMHWHPPRREARPLLEVLST